jgi:hypothetical protein
MAFEMSNRVSQSKVIKIINNGSKLAQAFNDLTFGPGDPVNTSQALQVGRVNIGQDGDVGLGNVRQPADFPETIHAEFNHCHFMFFGKAQQGLRHADKIIQIQVIFQDRKFAAKHLGNHFFRGGLAATAGYGHNRTGKMSPPKIGQISQGPEGIRYQDNAQVRGQGLILTPTPAVGCHQRANSSLEGARNKIMAVEFFSFEREVNLAALGGAGISSDADETGTGAPLANLASRGLNNFLNGKICGHFVLSVVNSDILNNSLETDHDL